MHEHNENEVAARLIAELAAGKSVALVSDAGTPLISDPGFRLVSAAHRAGIDVVAVPGPCAATAALSVAGLPTDRFCFEGFLPAKEKARRDRLAALAAERRTMVFFESVHRVAACVDDLVAEFGAEREGFIGRELTKLHEQAIGSTLGDLARDLAGGRIPNKGEYVIVVAGNRSEAGSSWIDVDRLLTDLAARLPAREAAGIVAGATGQSRNSLYRRLLEINESGND
jgi:16S rRNA (cytidine1402-2'-O)-methyltransferase